MSFSEFIHVRNEEITAMLRRGCGVLPDGNRPSPSAGHGRARRNPPVQRADGRKEKNSASVIAIAGDVESKLIDTSALEELNPYKFFDAAALYVGRVVNPEQARAVFNTAITTAVIDRGPTVISLCGDVAGF